MFLTGTVPLIQGENKKRHIRKMSIFLLLQENEKFKLGVRKTM